METCSEECYAFMSFERNLYDSFIFSCMFVAIAYYGWYRRKHTVKPEAVTQQRMSKFDKFLSYSFLLVFLVEIGYKYFSNQLVFLLQPCHVVTVLELFVLFTRGPHAELVLNVTIHILWAPLLAVVLPDTVNLLLPYEVETYWVQHGFLLLTPIYLLARDRFRVIRSSAIYWLSYSVMGLYHSLVLLWGGYLSYRNLNYMLCPNYPEVYPGDFLHDHLYRVHAFWYFAVLCFVLGRMTPAIAHAARALLRFGRKGHLEVKSK